MGNNDVAVLTLVQLLNKLSLPLRNREFVVVNPESTDSLVSNDVLYRSTYFGLILVQDGYSYYSIGDYTYEIRKGDILFFVPQEIFKIIYTSADFSERQLFFSAEMISDAGFNYRSNDILRSFSNNPSYVISGEEALFNRLLFHINELAFLNDIRNTAYFSNEMIWHHFSLIMYEIETRTRQLKDKINSTSREEEITTEFFKLVREYYIKHHDVQFYSDRLFLSRKYLTKIIKKTIFKTPKDILNQMLVIDAKIMLRSSNKNVNQVASLLNFSDQAVFSKFFKKQTGISPRDYKLHDLF